MPAKDNFQGVSNCYVFKSRLQEYAQKVGLPTPVYETIKEGPSHEPTFHSTVIVNDVRYDSLPGFSNRKAAEQSAAEVALMELSKSSDLNPHASLPVHETGLCKNLLQEYAQKMNFAIPLYQCHKDDGPGRAPHFSCTVEIGGIRYIGAVAKTKKEAEIKAARTALLAIQSCPTSLSKKPVDRTQLTVLPCNKRKETDCSIRPNSARALGTKKGRFKKVSRNRGLRNGQPIFTSNLELNIDGSNYEPFATGVVQNPGFGESVELAKDTIPNSEYRTTNLSSNDDGLRVSNIPIDMPLPLNGNSEVVQDLGFGESIELAKDTITNSECRTTNLSSNDDGLLVSSIPVDMPLPLNDNSEVVQDPRFGESIELAKDTIPNSECRTTNLSSNDDGLLVSNIPMDTPLPLNDNSGVVQDPGTTNLSSNDDGLLVSNIPMDMPLPLNDNSGVVQDLGFGESVELAVDTIPNSECRTTNLSSNDDGLLVSSIPIDMPPPLNGNSGALSSNQMNCGTSDDMSFPLSDVQPTSCEVGNVATGVTEELQ